MKTVGIGPGASQTEQLMALLSDPEAVKKRLQELEAAQEAANQASQASGAALVLLKDKEAELASREAVLAASLRTQSAEAIRLAEGLHDLRERQQLLSLAEAELRDAAVRNEQVRADLAAQKEVLDRDFKAAEARSKALETREKAVAVKEAKLKEAAKALG